VRDAYHEELDALTEALIEMTRLVNSAVNRASTALLDADLTLAESVIAADDAVDLLRDELDKRSFDLLARQQPVASDLRTIVTTLRMSGDLERMGDLARHVARVARRRFPESAVPAALRSTIVEMSQVAERLVTKAGSVIASQDVEAAGGVGRGRDRRHGDRSLLRAVRRPRGRGRPAGGLPRHRPAPDERRPCLSLRRDRVSGPGCARLRWRQPRRRRPGTVPRD
jgi:phosphate transport system protein